MIEAVTVMVVLGLLLGGILAFANIFFPAETDNKTETVTGMLPGYNCGGCGFPGCAGFAEAIVKGEITDLSHCLPCKAENKQEIVNYLNAHEIKSGQPYQITVK